MLGDLHPRVVCKPGLGQGEGRLAAEERAPGRVDAGQRLAQHALAQKLGLARRTGRKLTLTANGRRLAGDPEQLWRAVAAILPVGDSDFMAYTGELFLAMLLEAESRPFDEILATVWRAAGEEGFRETRTSEPPSEDDVSWAIHDTSNLCRALGLLTVGTGLARPQLQSH